MANYRRAGALLTLKNISLKFGDKLVLRDINIEVDDVIEEGSTRGQVCTLVGKSGAGKSQLFNVIAGLQQPTTGEVLIGTAQQPVKVGQIGMVAQNYPLFRHKTVLKNLLCVCTDRQKIDFYLNEFGLIDHINKYPAEISGGQRQRIAVIQQLLCSEHFILLDEPFSGLDPLSTSKLCEVITKIASMDELNTILISSHVIEPSLAVSDTVWVLGQEESKDASPLNALGDKIPGSTIRFVEDLAAQGLAWRKDIELEPEFVALCKKVRDAFKLI